MRLTKSTSFLLGGFIYTMAWWYTLQATNQTNTIFASWWGLAAQGPLVLLGGLLGLVRSYQFGFLRSVLSKALFFLSLGLISWSIGGFTWSYYNFVLNINVPYPSWADIGYASAIPLWVTGMIYLSLATGTKYGLRSLLGKLQVVLLPVIVTILSYYFLIIVARKGELTSGDSFLKVFFDFTYPVGDIVILTAALLVYGLSLRFLTGRYKWPVVIILLGFIIQFAGDFFYSYYTTVGTYANGCWVDAFFVIATSLIAFGVNSFDHRPLFPVTPASKPAAPTHTPDTLLISHIIKAHESLIGPIALDYAREIPGLQIYNLEHIEVTGNINEVLEKLVSEYANLFGKVAIEVSKEEVKKIPSYPPDHLPSVLK